MNPLILIRHAGHDTIKRWERKETRRLVREEAISRAAIAGQLQIPAADRDRRSVSQTATGKIRRRELRERTKTLRAGDRSDSPTAERNRGG
jgi:acyl-CoA synthetase (AMP-forming)/AMP-acid ligase II